MEGYNFFRHLENKQNRLKLLAILMLFFFTSLFFKIFIIIMEGGVFSSPSNEIQISNLKRYNILDVNGKLLATTINSYNFYISPGKVVFAEEMIEKLASIFPESVEEGDLLERIKNKKNRLVLVKREVTEEQKNLIISSGIEASEFEKTFSRVYPFGNLFSHIVGYLNVNFEGVYGLERSMNNKLFYEDVVTSLDARIQSIVHDKMMEVMDEYKTKSGFGIVANLRTGEVASLVSLPDFDPKRIQDPNSENMKNHAVSSVYYPGSISKMLTIAMAIQNGLPLDKTFKVDVAIPVDKKFSLKDEHVRKSYLKPSEILAFSSNVGSVLILEEYIGFTKQRKYLEEIGAFTPPKLELSPFEIGTPIYNSKAWPKSTHYTASYGYGFSLSPIHFTALARSVLGTGRKSNLTFLKEGLKNEDVGQVIFSKETILKTQELLREVVRVGTAKRANINGYDICGKTSTSLKYDAKKKAWTNQNKMVSFFAFFPCVNPRYIIYIGFDEPDKTEKDRVIQGGTVVAPLAGKIIAEIAPLLNIKPDAGKF